MSEHKDINSITLVLLNSRTSLCRSLNKCMAVASRYSEISNTVQNTRSLPPGDLQFPHGALQNLSQMHHFNVLWKFFFSESCSSLVNNLEIPSYELLQRSPKWPSIFVGCSASFLGCSAKFLQLLHKYANAYYKFPIQLFYKQPLKYCLDPLYK